MAGVLVTVGHLEESRDHFNAALAAYDEHRPQRSALGSDLGVFARAWYSHALWLLGDDAAAVGQVDEAIALARRLKDPYSETLALAYAALLHQLRRDVDRMLPCAREVIGLCDRYGFGYYGDWARLFVAWSEGQERPREAVASIEATLVRLDAQRAEARRPYYLSLLAESHMRAGDHARASEVLDRAITVALERVDLWWLPALYLQKSALQAPVDRDVTVRRALDLARAQRSESLTRRIVQAAAASA
jgi:predicted ATPase